MTTEDSEVRCTCHPGVRWTVETWGQPCPLSAALSKLDAAEGQRDAMREALSEVLDVIDAHEKIVLIDEPSDLIAGKASADDMIAAIRTRLASSATAAASRDERIRAEERERCAGIAEDEDYCQTEYRCDAGERAAAAIRASAPGGEK